MHSHSSLGPIALLTTIVSALPEKEILVPILPRQSSEEDYLSSVGAAPTGVMTGFLGMAVGGVVMAAL
ncbi:hypothetical protein BOTCAL_0249g00070 [Botryotinia calthae]|uniref:Uncharacterized protein n=1 Tax=Botryotinia calthae TaxID=38488 RepID=A0A4Y8CXA6_9HELO|nr:hypothetical protein BOTCAL_0249g00070 [Botryotinia calthae]